ncbi:N-acetylmuramoyl-L-alanine amidase [Gangjinia marincola]|uniref:N-acetylmuramoyl-L-alanine amidase n=1 Tax=Gangjinia marincola TaxID=578463 RepID=A0ABP3XP44_9FLAO
MNRVVLIFLLLIICAGASLSFASNQMPNPPKKFIVVLDAGHGGKDHGNLGNGYKEKSIALNIILKVGAALKKMENVEVIYTRDKDVFVDLKERGNIANAANADLFVSVHCNAHNSQAQGTETFVLGTHRNNTNFEIAKKENSVIFLEDNYEEKYEGFDPNSPESTIGLTLMQEEYLDQSIMLADFVQKQFTKKLARVNRGVKQAGFIVLYQTVMPSVLIEVGFLTNNKEGKYLNSSKGQNDMAKSITSAIIKYKESLNLVNQENITIYSDYDTNATVTTTNTTKVVVPTDENGITISNEDPEGIASLDNDANVFYRVQIAASGTKLEPKSYNFKGIKGVNRESDGSLYRYYVGETTSYNKANKLLKLVKSKGFPSSYIVAYKNGERVQISEARNSQLK